jgi:hypothetical protein
MVVKDCLKDMQGHVCFTNLSMGDGSWFSNVARIWSPGFEFMATFSGFIVSRQDTNCRKSVTVNEFN